MHVPIPQQLAKGTKSVIGRARRMQSLRLGPDLHAKQLLWDTGRSGEGLNIPIIGCDWRVGTQDGAKYEVWTDIGASNVK